MSKRHDRLLSFGTLLGFAAMVAYVMLFPSDPIHMWPTWLVLVWWLTHTTYVVSLVMLAIGFTAQVRHPEPSKP